MAQRTITREAFERAYAERSGTTVKSLHSYGKFAVPAERDRPYPCDYGEDCEGWHMVYKRGWEEDVEFGYRPAKDLELFPLQGEEE